MKMSNVSAAKSYEFPKAHGHETLKNFGPSATVAAIVLVTFWLFKAAVDYLPLPSGWDRQLPSVMAIAIFCGTLGISHRVAFRDALGRWGYVAAFGIVFWLGTLF
jgi:hypothetical protein